MRADWRREGVGVELRGLIGACFFSNFLYASVDCCFFFCVLLTSERTFCDEKVMQLYED